MRYRPAAVIISLAFILIAGFNPAFGATANVSTPGLGFEGAEVAILDSGYTRHYADLKAWTYSEEFIDATWLMSTLARSGISAAVINDHDVEIGALSSYKALILPATSCMSSLAIDQIEAFATAGGRVFSTYDTSLRDDFWRTRTDYGLSSIMGVRYSSTGTSGNNHIVPAAKSHPIFRGIESDIPVPSTYGLTNKMNPNAIILAKWSTGQSAIVETEYGIYCSENLFARKNLSSPEVVTLITNTIDYLVNTKYKAKFNLGRLDTKATWYRPAAREEQIRADVKRLANANFNLVFVDSFYDGYTIYPSDVGVQNPIYSEFDPLAIAIDEGHKQGIQIHAWLETFCVGFASEKETPPQILQENPDWAAVGLDGRIPSAAESDRCFLSPAHPQVQEFILDLARELVTEHAVDGVHFDYLRYPYGRTIPYDYAPTITKLATEDLGFQPRDVRLDIAKWNAWFDWRCNNLTSFMIKLSDAIRSAAPGTLVSAAVYPYPEAILTRMQDWKAWCEKGCLDFVVVFTYTQDLDLFDTMIRAAQSFAGNKTQMIAGIDADSMAQSQASEGVPALVEAARAAGARGVSIFSANAISENVLTSLKSGPFDPSTRSETPFYP